jgi:membrane protease YdiL (CAAX protease family)
VNNDELEAGVSAVVPSPSRWALLGLAALLLMAYLGLQLVVALAFLFWMMVTHQPIIPEQLMKSEVFTWVSLAAGALGAVAAVCMASVWPWVWRLVTSRNNGGVAQWLAWRRQIHLAWWLVPLITLPFMLLVVGGISWLFGDAQVDVQLLLFATPALRIASSIVVSTIVPLAEEFIFRGALYNALLPRAREGRPEWLRQLLPLGVTSVLFAAVHLLAGFETAAAIVEVTILAFYLGGLRAVTGSVKASTAAHITWNLVSSLVLAAGFYH